MTLKWLFPVAVGIWLVLISTTAFAQNCDEMSFRAGSITAEENGSIEYPLLLQNESDSTFYIEGVSVSDDSAFFDATYLEKDKDSIESDESAEITIKIETNEVSSDKSGEITVKAAGHFFLGPNCSFSQIQQSFEIKVKDSGNGEEAEETGDIAQTETQESGTLPEETAPVGSKLATVDAPRTIIVQQAQKEVVVAISNDSATEQDFSAHFSAPFGSSLSPSDGKIGAGETATLILSIFPQEALEGSTYNCLLEAQVGGEKISRNISVIFKGKESEGMPQGQTGGGNAGFFSMTWFSASATGLFSYAEGLLTPENALNAALVLVAAILLIAFIARFVKRLEASK